MDNMSAKRRATTDLNHENWDRETEPEHMGTFQTAPEDELKNRVIRKARRKLSGAGSSTPGDDTDNQPKSVFSGFTGFGKASSVGTTVSGSTVSSGGGLSDLGKKSEGSGSNVFSFLSKFTAPPTETKTDKQNETPSAAQSLSTNNNNYNFAKSNTYYAKLKGLNQAVSNWIKSHVDKNPLCLLTPIFKDYEKYLAEIENSEGSNASKATETNTQSKAMTEFKFSATPVPSSTFSFGLKSASADSGANTTKPSIFPSSSQKSDDKTVSTSISSSFSFGPPPNSGTTTTTSGFTPTSNTGFSFSGAKPFSFGNIAPPPAAEPSADKDEGDEEDEPPKVEFKAVVEEDSIYSQRCKVFVKNDGNFSDRGVGTLYLKPVKDSGKTQLLVRADTNLGNILVNLILNDSIPTQRMGKNNVMLVCIPTPDVDKPTPMLLRVKTAEDADKLLETIDKHKK